MYTYGRVDEPEEDDSAYSANIILRELREPFGEHLIQTVTHTAKLWRKPEHKNTKINKYEHKNTKINKYEHKNNVRNFTKLY